MSENKIPVEVLDLVRFMCNTWASIDKWACTTSERALGKYPVIQGTSNQINLKKIGQQDYDLKKLNKAVKWMIENQDQNKQQRNGG